MKRDRTPCFFTMDPASLLVTSHYEQGLPEIPYAWLAQEYYEDDFNKMADVARSTRGVGTLHEATGGDLSRSARYRLAMQPMGSEQEALTALRAHRRGLGESSTTEIAERLVVSPHTVQEHFKNIFEKTGVRSRRDLVGKVFFAHYEPRLRDNERRATNGQTLRGGPFRTDAATSELSHCRTRGG